VGGKNLGVIIVREKLHDEMARLALIVAVALNDRRFASTEINPCRCELPRAAMNAFRCSQLQFSGKLDCPGWEIGEVGKDSGYLGCREAEPVSDSAGHLRH